MVEGCAWGHPGTTEALGILAAGAGWHALSLPTHRGHFVLVSLGNSRRDREAQLFFSPPFPCCLPHQTHPQPLLEASQAVPTAQARKQQKPRQDFLPILEALCWVFNKRLPLLLFTSQPSFSTNVPVPPQQAEGWGHTPPPPPGPASAGGQSRAPAPALMQKFTPSTETAKLRV